MNIALIGYGRMGHEIESIAIKRGHVIKLIIDQYNEDDLNGEKLKGIDVAIEFSSPEAAVENVMKCIKEKVPVVSGTTGWNEQYSEVAAACNRFGTSFIHSSNFSIGVNLFFKINSELARQMEKYKEYKVSVEEIHHTKKLDAPSGTAISLVNGIISQNSDYNGWSMDKEHGDDIIPVNAIREGNVPGTHIVTWNSEIDSITMKHEARNRKGFALGAVVAAEYIAGRKGVFTMNDVMGF
jgi:4-hydroxy-tetrahydrodipicolinate reductase